jgi:uncharacterized membrane protein
LRPGQIWRDLRGSLWFVPSLLVVGSALLAFLMVALDRAIGTKAAVALPLLFDAGPEGARELLGVIASSLLTVAGVAFSFAVVVFSFASTQFSPRTLRNFMEDKTNQTVLGTLSGGFVYCLLVLRTVRLEGSSFVNEAFVPTFSVSVAVVLALISIGLFVFFLHHTAESIQAYHIIERVGNATSRVVKRAFKDEEENGEPHNSAPEANSLDAYHTVPAVEVPAGEEGYVQSINFDSIIELADKHDLMVRIPKVVGHFVMEGKPLATIEAKEDVDKDVVEGVRGAFTLGHKRSPDEDLLYGLLQLSDVAVKALSPGVNDPTTAIMCLNQMGAILSEASLKRPRADVRYGKGGRPRVYAPAPDFREMVGQAFNGVRRYSMGDASIAIRMLEIIEEIAADTVDEGYLDALRRQAKAIVEEADRNIKNSYDREDLNETIRKIQISTNGRPWQLETLEVKRET